VLLHLQKMDRDQLDEIVKTNDQMVMKLAQSAALNSQHLRKLSALETQSPVPAGQPAGQK